MQQLEDFYAELAALSAERRERLEDSRKLWQFFADISEEESWIKEKEQMLSSADIGRDLTSINLLLTKQKVGALILQQISGNCSFLYLAYGR